MSKAIDLHAMFGGAKSFPNDTKHGSKFKMIFETEYCSSEPNVRNIVLLSENAYYAPEVICTLGVNP